MSETLHRIHISLLIEGDYRKRGVFPMLRLDCASKISGSSIYFENISMDLVLSLMKDAKQQREFVNRSMTHAYGAILRQMDRIIREPEIKAEKRQRIEDGKVEFKDNAIRDTRVFLNMLRGIFWKHGGYRFDNETLAEAESLMDKLADVIGGGRIVHPSDDEARPTVNTVAAHKSDTALQNFIKAAISDLSLVKNESPEGA